MRMQDSGCRSAKCRRPLRHEIVYVCIVYATCRDPSPRLWKALQRALSRFWGLSNINSVMQNFLSAGYQDLSSRLVKALREAIETDMGDATERDVRVSLRKHCSHVQSSTVAIRMYLAI